MNATEDIEEESRAYLARNPRRSQQVRRRPRPEEEIEARSPNTTSASQTPSTASQMTRGRGRSRNTDRQVSRPQNIKCFRCHEYGHIGRECPKYGDDVPNAYEKPTQKAPITQDPKAAWSAHSAHYVTKRNPRPTSDWILDTGATDNMSSDRQKFLTYRKRVNNIQVANGKMLKVIGIGQIRLRLSAECGGQEVILTEALHVPEVAGNLVSAMKIVEKGYRIEITRDEANIFNLRGRLTSIVRRSGNLLCL